MRPPIRRVQPALPVLSSASRRAIISDGQVSPQRRAILTTFLTALASNALPVLPASAKGGELAVFNVASAALDQRSYRGLILTNGLRVLLASDTRVAKGAASMDVQVGYMSDPADLPGLAHFCEHMLFLGTQQFPNEGDFERIVAAGSGSNNAYTAAEETNYYFDVNGDALQPALARFAGFFTTPLFSPSATAREVNAIDSEHSKNLQSDFWRFEQLFKLRADPSHPYAKFGTGNRQTLRDGDAGARSALLDFHARYYQADRMSLALIGPQSLDALQRLAVSNFANVPTTNPPLPPSSDAYDGLPMPFRPSEAPPIATLMVPVNDLRSLKVAWCIKVTDLPQWIDSKPEELWETLLRNRAAGGLLPLLKRKGLASGLEASVEEFTRSWIVLAVDINLTPLGLTKWRAVSSMLFAYLRTLSAAGVPSYLVDEFRSLAKTSFEYAEPTEPQQWASSASTNLLFYPPEKWVSGPSFIGEGSEVGCQYMLEQCSDPRNALITLVAKANEGSANMQEPIYGTRYGILPLTREVEAWRTAKVPADLAPPKPNPFVPTDFRIKCASGGGACVPAKRDGGVSPRVLSDVPGLRVHFLQDSTFNRPKALAFFLFRSNLLYASPAASVTATLFQSVFADVLQDSTYQASIAGLGAGLGAEYNGLALSASGYNARLPELVRYVAGQVRTAELTQPAFERQREQLRQSLANFNRKQPISLCSYRRNLALETPRYSVDELAEAVEAAKLSDLTDFQRQLLPDSLLEAFLVGNLDEAEASKMVSDVTAAIPSAAPLPADQIPKRRLRVLEPGQPRVRQFVAPNPAEANSAVEVYVQVGMDEGDDWLLLGLLSQLIEQPFYEELRTKQQLGYIVQSGPTEAEGVRALVFNVQSSVLPPPQVVERIDAFLASFRARLASLPEAELATNREAFATQATDIDKRLGQQASRLWGEIVKRRYDYGRPWRVAQRVRKVSREQLLAFFDKYVAPGSPQSKRLTTQVFAQKAAPATLAVDELPGNYYPRPLERPLSGERPSGVL